MGPEEQDDRPAEPHPELLAGMKALREAIGRQRYPGSAWPVRRARARRLVIAAAMAASAAAAVLLLAVALRQPLPSTPPPVSERLAAVTLLAAGPTLGLDVPGGIGLPSPGEVTLDVPSVSMPAVGEIAPAVTLSLDVPSFSALSLGSERSLQ